MRRARTPAPPLILLLTLLNPLPLPAAPPINDDRPPAVAGQFYPGDKAALAEQVDRLFLKAPRHPIDGKLVALLVPHAGYAYSGPVAAEGYKSMSAGWKTFILIGPSHHADVPNAVVYARGAFVTPLGRVPVDEALAAQLLKDPLFAASRDAHAPEHSIEVQLPFLQRVFGDFKIVPILTNARDPETARRIGETVARAIRQTGATPGGDGSAAGRDALVLLSSDLAHYPTKDVARRADLTLLRALRRFDPVYLATTYQWLMEHREPGYETPACGGGALMAGVAAAKALGANQATLWRYANSGELTGVVEHNVGYAAVAFTRAEKPAAEPAPNDAQRRVLLSAAHAALADGLAQKPFAFAPLSDDPALNGLAAVFVTLWKDGRLRGCVGAAEPRLGLQDAVRYYARAAAFQDNRFKPLEKAELGQVKIEVSILTPPTDVPNADAVAPRRDGVIVEKDGKVGLFLPDVWIQRPGKEEFLSELCAQKAGLPSDCWKDPRAKLSTFRTQTFREE